MKIYERRGRPIVAQKIVTEIENHLWPYLDFDTYLATLDRRPEEIAQAAQKAIDAKNYAKEKP